jgi:FkbH-like protein
MSSDRLSLLDLPWLPRLSVDFKSTLAKIQEAEDQDWSGPLALLSQQALGLNQAMALSRASKRLAAERPGKSLATFKLGILSNATLDFIVPFLDATALRYGIALEVVTGPFGQAMQAALDPASVVNMSRPDAVLLALDHRGLPFRDESGGAWPPYQAEAALRDLDAMRQGIRKHSGATCLMQSVPTPLAPLFGSLDATLAGSARAAIAQFNATLARDVASHGDVLIDVDALSQAVGLDEWHNDRDWHLAKLPFARSALPLYADIVLRAIAAMRGKARKCLVLDLDNTLWGGVIGDDGLEGIALDQGDARGEAHRAVQMAALDLRRRGIVLAVCSKNDDATARLPFREHPGMLLKEDDIAVFVANWDDKASNLERIAQRLDIGLDALVLLDDNPAERAQVRLSLPQVAVPELGEDPSTFVRTLLMAGYFESVAFTPEDLARADQYRGNAHRSELLEGSRDLGQFLQSLEMQIRFAPFQAQGRKRITQLINKTNQFNLTTRRYTETQVGEIETSAAHYSLQVNLADRFGDNGMICAIICQRRDEEWEIDSWLMSCRVLNRKVEEAICNRIARDAKSAGATRLIGLYRPTPRNNIVARLFEQLGFSRVDSPDDAQRWVLDLPSFQPFVLPMSESP